MFSSSSGYRLFHFEARGGDVACNGKCRFNGECRCCKFKRGLEAGWHRSRVRGGTGAKHIGGGRAKYGAI